MTSPRKRPLTAFERKTRTLARDRERYYQNSEKKNAQNREWKKNNPERVKEVGRIYSYLYHHGITLEDAKLMLENQGGKCAICNSLISFGGVTGAQVDHCHTTNKIRGILCKGCNTGLGHFEDNITTLFGAINYLRSFSSWGRKVS